MKALTLWQPWASLVVEGFKPFEFRSRPAPRSVVGQRIVIHASARPIAMEDLRFLLHNLDSELRLGTLTGGETVRKFLRLIVIGNHVPPLGAGIGTAIVGTPRIASEIWPEEFTGDQDRLDRANWAMPMQQVERWDRSVPARGFQNYWSWKEPTP